MPNPSTSAVVGTLGPQVVAQGALQAVGPAVSGASIAPGITVGGLFVAPLFVPALIARIFSKPSPTAAFEVPEMSMPRGTNIAQFGDTFKNVNGGIIPAALTVPGFTRGRLSRQEKSAGASASFVAQDLQRAAFAEFAINPPQAELATKFLNAHMKPGPRPTGPVVGSVAWHRSKRTGGGGTTSFEGLVLQWERGNANKLKEVARVRRIASEKLRGGDPTRTINYNGLVTAFLRGGVPDAELPPRFKQVFGDIVLADFSVPAAPPPVTAPSALSTPVRVELQRPAVVQARQLSQRTQEAPTMPSPSTNLPALGGFSAGLEGFLGGLGGLVGAATPLLQTILPQLLPQRSVPVALPGGAPIGASFAQFRQAGQFADPRLAPVQQAAFPLLGPAIAGGLGALGEQLFDLIPGGAGNILSGGTCITPVAGRQTMRLPSRVDVPTRDAQGNQRFTTFKNMGRPILWSGDVAAAKRVKRISSKVSKFGRRRGGR